MSYQVVIQGNVIELPEVSASPNWAPGQVTFNQAVANALQFSVGTFDIPPQTFAMQSNLNTNVDIGGLSFPTSEVRSATIYFYVFRQTNSSNEGQAGFMTILYNPNNSVSNKWEVASQSVGESTVTFTVQDNGQVSFSSDVLAGSNHIGTIGYYSKVIQQVY